MTRAGDLRCRELAVGDPAWDDEGARGPDEVTTAPEADAGARGPDEVTTAPGADAGAADGADRGAFAVLKELRTHLDRDAFDRIHRAGATQGLRYTGAFDDAGRCLGVAGWRILDTTSVGRRLYVDDLVTTASARSGGVGTALLDHLTAIARTEGCAVLDLDSGQQRLDAHRFYRREGFDERNLHFTRAVDPA